MRRFFADEWDGSTALIRGSEASHMARVLRMAPGEEIIIPCQGEERICELIVVSSELVKAKEKARRQCAADPQKKITLYQAYMKSDKMEWIAQKAVELGISEMVPFISSRCVKVPDQKSAAKAKTRLERIAFEAIKQCGRASMMSIEDTISFESLCRRVEKTPLTLFAYENTDLALRDALDPEALEIALIIGPEGGFSKEEAQRLVDCGARQVSLGKRILRGETAAIALSAIVAYETGC